eukprot:15199072-Alexandrium_andersonii.AAC.1
MRIVSFTVSKSSRPARIARLAPRTASLKWLSSLTSGSISTVAVAYRRAGGPRARLALSNCAQLMSHADG